MAARAQLAPMTRPREGAPTPSVPRRRKAVPLTDRLADCVFPRRELETGRSRPLCLRCHSHFYANRTQGDRRVPKLRMVVCSLCRRTEYGVVGHSSLSPERDKAWGMTRTTPPLQE